MQYLYFIALFSLCFRSEKNITSSFEFVVALNNYGGAFSKVLLHFYLIEGKLNMDLFDRLLNAV